MHIREYRSNIWLPLPPDELFRFFAHAPNLDTITPLWLHFHIVTQQPIVMGVGTTSTTSCGTRIRDIVSYAVPLDFLINRWFVKSDIQKIFDFRTEALRKHFAIDGTNLL